MTGGTITNCSALNGGAIAVHTASKGTTSVIDDVTYNLAADATITGGTISGNTATENGGGIRVLRANLSLSNCEITDNTANGTGGNGGGGVSISNTTAIVQDLNISGTVKIYGNHGQDDARENLFFNNIKTISLNGDLDPASEIYFGADGWSTTAKYFNINGYSYDIGSFICNTDEFGSYYKSGYIMLKRVIPAVIGCNASLKGNIELNVKMNLGAYNNNDTTVTYAYSYTKKGQVKNVEKTLTKAELTKSGSDFTFPLPIEAACMTAPITITINYGTEGASVSKTITFEQYAKAIMNGNNEAQKNVAKALLIYGGYAQVQLDINTDSLPGLSDVDFSTAYADSIQSAAYTITKDTKEAFYGATVSFLSETSVKMYFKKSVLGDEAPDMTVTYASGSETISGTPNGSYYEYVIKGPSGTGFAATQYASEFNFSIGEDISGSYSVDTYLKAIKDSTKASAAMKNLAEAYNYYAQKCIAMTTA